MKSKLFIFLGLFLSSSAFSANIKTSIQKTSVNVGEQVQISYSILSNSSRKVGVTSPSLQNKTLILRRYQLSGCPTGTGTQVGTELTLSNSHSKPYTFSTPGTFYLKPEVEGDYNSTCFGPITVFPNQSTQFEAMSLIVSGLSTNSTNVVLEWKDNAGNYSTTTQPATVSLYSDSSCSIKTLRTRTVTVSPKNGLSSLSVQTPSTPVDIYIKATSGLISSLGTSGCLKIPRSCPSEGYTAQGNKCSKNTLPCSTPDGSGLRQYNSSTGLYGTCVPSSSLNSIPTLVQPNPITTSEDVPASFIASVSDQDSSDSVGLLVSENPQNGTVQISGLTVSYIPNSNFNGIDSFSIKATDGKSYSEIKTVSVSVSAVNDSPVSATLSETTQEDQPKEFVLSGSDPESSPVTYELVSQPANGSLSGAAPYLTYTPNQNFAGSDSLTYRVNDGLLNSQTSTVSFIVSPVNDPPSSENKEITTTEDSPISENLLFSDIDNVNVTYAIVSNPSNGSLTLHSSSTGAFTYTPNSGYNGQDSFSYRVYDGSLYSSVSTVNIIVTSVNNPPIANNKLATTNEDTPTTIIVSGSDPEGQAISYSIETMPAHGVISGTGPIYTYTPNSNYNGSDSFAFKVSDGVSFSETGLVSITVNSVNDLPTLTTISTLSGATALVPFQISYSDLISASNESDVDGDSISFQISSVTTGDLTKSGVPVTGGTTMLSQGESVVWTPTSSSGTINSFKVRAFDGSAYSIFPIQVKVLVSPALSLSYSPNSFVFTKGTQITTISPTVTGTATFTVNPTLPSGLSINQNSGEISGTPSVTSAQSSYLIVATGSNGQTASTQINIEITDSAPYILYSDPNFILSKNSQMVPRTPTNLGGEIISCSVSPILPTGLSINQTNCEISGTPTELYPESIHVVTATNSGGTHSTNISITVNDIAPFISYGTSEVILVKNTTIDNLTATNSGGEIVSCSVSPSLPSGLSINNLNCLISGTPSETSGRTSYSITATNSGGQSLFQLYITVNDQSPTNLVYSQTNSVYTKNQTITTNTPSNSGGVITSYSVSPSLPSGLTLNTTTGEISGTPIVASSSSGYLITGTNQTGSTSSTITISVNDLDPVISYSGSPFSFTKDSLISPITPATISNVSSCLISPVLPTGLVFNSSSCVISGTPSITSPATSYQITATNSTGQTTLTTISITVINAQLSCPSGQYDKLGVCALIPTISNSFLEYTGRLSSSEAYSCALTAAGGVKCWGQNFAGELGDGTIVPKLAPVDVVGLTSGVVAVSTGANHTCALTSAGGVKCWGENSSGQLGDGTITNRLTPVNVSGLTSGVVSISVGATFSCALTSTGGVKCWGSNDVGQLGDGTLINKTTPVTVSGLTSGIISIDAASIGSHICSINSVGGTKCWGLNSSGQLGDGTTINRLTPSTVSGLTSGIVAVAAGAAHTCALTSAGGVKCWGFDSDGQLGSGSFLGFTTSPVNVTGLSSGIVAVSAGAYNSCAITSSGSAKCWGYNGYGVLGNGDPNWAPSPVPVNVIGLSSGAISISPGYFHNCALTSSGGVKCLGDNGNGEFEGLLGDSTTTSSTVLVNVTGGNIFMSSSTGMMLSGTCAGDSITHSPQSSTLQNKTSLCSGGAYLMKLESSLLNNIFTGISSPNRAIKVYEVFNGGTSPLSNSSISWP